MGWKKSLIALAALAGLTAPVHAQDRWTGVYVGGSVGGAWTHVDWSYFNLVNQNVPRSPSGVIAGAHLGYQQQFGQWVLGAELAYTGGNINETGRDAPVFAPTFDANSRFQNVLTIGPRVGWVFHRNWMAFATGGYAQADIMTEFYTRGFPNVTSRTNSRNEGWFVGGGVEYALTKNWIFGVEYQHMDFNTELQKATVVPATGSARFVSADADVVRARISFKLGPGGLD